MTPEPTEVRLLTGAELRASDEGSELGFEGRLVPYDVWAPIGGLFEERMAKSVFKKSIAEAAGNLPLMARHNHDSWPLGKSVEWDDRDDGLYGRWIMADTEQAREAHKLVQEGYLRGLSCGFIPMRDQEEWEMREPPQLSRVTRKQARLAEASVVPVPTWSEAIILNTRSSVAPEGLKRLTPHLDAWEKWRQSLTDPTA